MADGPDWHQFLRERLPPLGLSGSREHDILEELAQQLEQRYDEERGSGASADLAEARAASEIANWDTLAARIRLAERPLAATVARRVPDGWNAESFERRLRQSMGGSVMVDWVRDLRYAVRVMLREPGFTAGAVLTLALSIGANTAMFGVFNAVLLRSLPFPQPDRIVAISRTTAQGQAVASAVPEVADIADHNRSFAAVAGYDMRPINITGADAPERVRALFVTAGFFRVFGIQPPLGRSFSRGDEEWGHHRVAIITRAMWQSRFGDDPNIIGRSLAINNAGYTIVGVLPANFWFLDLDAQVLLPLAFAPGAVEAGRGNHFLSVAGRLGPGRTADQASADLRRLTTALAPQVPSYRTDHFEVRPEREQMVGDSRASLWIVMASVGLVLLIACFNLASLAIARALSRRKEMALRAALGATRGLLVRQVVVESLALSLLGGAMGVAVAAGATRPLKLIPSTVLPMATLIEIDVRVLIFALAISIFAGVLFAVVPLLYALRGDARLALNDGRSAVAGSGLRHRTRSLVIVAEVAMAMTLLAGAGLLIKSMHLLTRVDAGFDPNNVLTFSVYLPAQRYLDAGLGFSPHMTDRANAFVQEAIERVRAIHGVRAVGMVSNLPILGAGWDKVATFYDRPLPTAIEQLPTMEFRPVAGDYFRAMGIRVVKGRIFDDRDRLGSPYVVVVNEEFAHRYIQAGDPIGSIISVNPPLSLIPAKFRPQHVPDDYPQKHTIVGVVGNARYASLAQPAGPFVYAPYAQDAEGVLNVSFVVRTDGDPTNMVPLVRSQLNAIDKTVPLGNITTMDAGIARSIARPRTEMFVLGAFGALALLLVATGIYGLMSFVVAQRTAEIGVRLALGAHRIDVLGMMLRQGLSLALAGIAIGLGLAAGTTRVMKTVLYGITPTDPTTFAAAVGVLLGVALAACWIPARRATRVDPIVALRNL